MDWFTNFFEFIKSLFAPHAFTGVNFDERPQSQKNDDIQDNEVYGASIVTWTEKTSFKQYSQRDQTFFGSTCLAHATAKATEVEGKGVNSAKDIYFYRSNKNGGEVSSAGMIPTDALKILSTRGITSEQLLPSNGIQELDATFNTSAEIIDSENKTKGGEPVTLPIDIDTIASAFDRGLGVILCFKFAQKEWIDVPVLTSAYSGIHHGVAVEDRTIYKGQKALIIGDSWLPDTTIGKKGQRIITEDFLLARCTFAGYRLIMPPPTPVPKPNHKFTVDLSFGMKSSEVALLQERLKSEGLFPSIPVTGYFGAVTKSAVVSYQKANGISPTGYCGVLTRTSLNK